MAITKKASNIAVWVILVLLILGLVGFGVGDFGGSVRTVAKVGETEITVDEYARVLQNRLRQSGEAGGPSTFAEAQAQGLDRAVLQELLAQAALIEASRRAGVSVGDERVSQRILNMPAFQGPGGTFDREAYDFVLDRNGLTVSEFEAQVRRELASNLLQGALASGLAPQPAYGEAVYSFVAERRTITLATLGPDALDAPVPAPDDAAVAAYYEANPDTFRLPERKLITFAWMTPAMVADRIEVSEDDLRAAYAAREAEFVRPARRMVERLGFADAPEAQAALDAIEAGETDFDTILAERGLAPGDVDLGVVTEADLDAAGADVFALEEPGVVGPLPSPVGPALFRVNAVLDAQETPFEEVRADLRREIAEERAIALIETEIEPLNDLLAGGATLEDIAAESAMELGTIAWTGAESGGIAGYADFREAARTVTEDDFPEIDLLEDGSIFALRLDAVAPPEVPPLDEVREAATEGARAAAIRAALADEAAAAVTAIEDGATFAEAGLDPQTITGLSRQGVIAELPQGAIETVFAMAPGEVRRIDGADSLNIVRLDTVTEGDPSDPAAAALRQALRQQASQSLAQDVLTLVAREVEGQSGIEVNQAALNAVHSRLQ